MFFFCLQNRVLLSEKCIPGLRTICYLVVLKNKILNYEENYLPHHSE